MNDVNETLKKLIAGPEAEKQEKIVGHVLRGLASIEAGLDRIERDEIRRTQAIIDANAAIDRFTSLLNQEPYKSFVEKRMLKAMKAEAKAAGISSADELERKLRNNN